MSTERINYNVNQPSKYAECSNCKIIQNIKDHFQFDTTIKVNGINYSVIKLNIECIDRFTRPSPRVLTESTAIAEISPDLLDKYLRQEPATITVSESKWLNCPHHLAERRKKRSKKQ